ncbi:hypothetical protein D3C81_239320 [compost metagenome]
MSSRGIAVASTSLAELFDGKSIFASDQWRVRGRLHIPEYQRPYRWGVEQLQRLISDLNKFFGAPVQTRCNFYLGTIVLHQKAGKLNIIDGQQRLTSLLLFAHCMDKGDFAGCLKFSAPESQEQIQANLRWLRQQACPVIDFARVNITLVVTRSEDDAYRFFETMNTGGVRLNGPQIIKAHHLRAIVSQEQDRYAREWEAMDDLDGLVDIVMTVRYWEKLRWRELSSYRNKSRVRDEIVLELAELACTEDGDLAYVHAAVARAEGIPHSRLAKAGYAMRQPLDAGINSIHYLQYLHGLRAQLKAGPGLQAFQKAYTALVVEACGSDYLKKLYDSTLLFYVSRFGTENIYEASLWLFRSVYSPRLTNEKMVRESTVQSFACNTPILDWIGASFNHRQLMQFLQSHRYDVDEHNLAANTVKGKFVMSVRDWFKLDLPADNVSLAKAYDAALRDAIKQAVLKGGGR